MITVDMWQRTQISLKFCITRLIGVPLLEFSRSCERYGQGKPYRIFLRRRGLTANALSHQRTQSRPYETPDMRVYKGSSKHRLFQR